MSLKPHLRFICINLFIVLSSTVYAADTVKENKALNSIAQAQQFISEHKGRFNGKSINYTATAGETYLRDKHGKETASIFTFAYTKKNNNKDKNRPVTFIWNGGPGSASTWLHMGAFGPKRCTISWRGSISDIGYRRVYTRCFRFSVY